MFRRIGVLASLAVFAAMSAGFTSAQASHTTTTAGVCVFDGLSGTLNPGIQDAVPDALQGPLSPLDVERGDYFFTSGGASPPSVGVLCAGVFAGHADIGGDALQAVNPSTTAFISSNGHYDNVVCGTGFAHDLDGSGTVLSGTGVLGNSITATGAGYEIPFVGGNGPLLIGPDGAVSLAEATEYLPRDGETATSGLHSPDGVGVGALPPDPSGADDPDGNRTPEIHGRKSSPYTGAGFVHITPDMSASNPNGPDNCVLGRAQGGPNNRTDQFQVHGFFVVVRP